MNRAPSLKDILSELERELASPAMDDAWTLYDSIKGEFNPAQPEGNNPIPAVRQNLRDLIQATDWTDPAHAQTLQFAQAYIAAQIKALNKGRLPFSAANGDIKTAQDNLKHALATLENALPAAQVKQQSKQAINQQRIENNSARIHEGRRQRETCIDSTTSETGKAVLSAHNAIVTRLPTQNITWTGKATAFFNPYNNWLDGTLSEEQAKTLACLQWQTATAPFKPIKGTVSFTEHFVTDRLKTPIVSGLVIKLIYDTATFMVDVTGAHPSEVAAASSIQAFSDSQDGDDIEDLWSLSAHIQTQPDNDAQIAQHCMDKVNTDTNLIGMTLEAIAPQYCPEVSQGLQHMFTVSTTTPRTMQDGQKAVSEFLLKDGTVLQDSYNHHHAMASKALEHVAMADVAFHFALLFWGMERATVPLVKHRAKILNKIGHSATQTGRAFRNRPLTLSGAAAGLASYPLTHNGDWSLHALSYTVIGALIGYMAQRQWIHKKQNKNFIGGLNNGAFNQAATSPPSLTSLDRDPHYVRKAVLGTAIGTAVLQAALISANNAGLLNSNSPDLSLWMGNAAMFVDAWLGAAGSWLAFDKLDDFFYHKTFPQIGAAFVFAVGLPVIYGWEGCKNQIKKAPSRLEKAYSAVSNNIMKTSQIAALALALPFSQSARAPEAIIENPNINTAPALHHEAPEWLPQEQPHSVLASPDGEWLPSGYRAPARQQQTGPAL